MSARQVHPFRAYLRDLPDAWRVVRQDLGEAARSARYLWPFMWRATADWEREQAERDSFELGREYAALHPAEGS